ncbi:MAG: hypothetical protein JW847_06895 [Candidatus Omnitrophica bacterium]|nr:hypothetical protein [Candidatus Omnitrophota bacterium]
MSGENQEIKIVGVDKEAIRTGSDTKEHWVVPFKLSLKPDQSWQARFYEIQKRDANIMKRKLQLDENSIIAEVSAADDLQKVLDAVKVMVVEANVLCEKDYQKKLKIRQELEVLQKEQRDATQKFKDDSDRLVF